MVINLCYRFTGLNAVIRHVSPPVKIVPNPQLILADVPLELFHVEDTTLSARKGRSSWRTFNTDFVQTTADTEYHRFFQYNVLGTGLKFVFERDAYRRIVDVYKLDENKRPVKGRKYLPTYVATINGIQFLVHKNSVGSIVGASAPPNQVSKRVVANHTPRTEPDAEGPRHKRSRILPSPTHN